MSEMDGIEELLSQTVIDRMINAFLDLEISPLKEESILTISLIFDKLKFSPPFQERLFTFAWKVLLVQWSST